MSDAVTLPPRDRDRLAKLLGLLGSDHVGERAAAGLKAHELVKAAGLTWPQVIESPALPPPPPPPPVPPPSWEWQPPPSYSGWGGYEAHQLRARACLNSGAAWSTWESAFLGEVARRRIISPRQSAKLDELCTKAGRARGGRL